MDLACRKVPDERLAVAEGRVQLNFKRIENKFAKDAVLVLPGFNECILRYVEVAHAIHAAGFSVLLLDHRGQGLSDREPGFKGQNAFIADFESSTMGDVIALAEATKSSVVGEGGALHVLGHSMGGLIAARCAAARQDLFDGRLVLSCPCLETVWGDKPPGLPRAVAKAMAAVGAAFGASRVLPPVPGAQLCWWDPSARIEGVDLTHDAGQLDWYWALRATNPRVALNGCTLGWIGEIVRGQEGLAAAAPRAANPTLVLTAELDALVKECGQAAWVAAAPDARRVKVMGAFHEPLFEAAPARAAALALAVGWLKGRISVPKMLAKLPPPPAATGSASPTSVQTDGGLGRVVMVQASDPSELLAARSAAEAPGGPASLAATTTLAATSAFAFALKLGAIGCLGWYVGAPWFLGGRASRGSQPAASGQSSGAGVARAVAGAGVGALFGRSHRRH